MTGIETIALIASLAGTAVTAVGTIAGGAAEKQNAYYEAQQLDAKGAEERAAAQRESQQQQKETDLALSRNTAVSAASGFGATDPTVEKIQSDIAGYGAYKSAMTTYGGRERQAGYRAQAEGRRAEGRAAQVGSYFKAAGTLLSAAGGLGGKYGGPAPAAAGAPMDLRPWWAQ